MDLTLKLDTIRIGVIGLGYVGLPLAVEFGKRYPTLGFDINPHRILQLTDGIDTTLSSLDDRYTRMQESIDATVARYRTQFASLDSLVSQMNSTSDYLTQQFDALSAQTNQ